MMDEHIKRIAKNAEKALAYKEISFVVDEMVSFFAPDQFQSDIQKNWQKIMGKHVSSLCKFAHLKLKTHKNPTPNNNFPSKHGDSIKYSELRTNSGNENGKFATIIQLIVWVSSREVATEINFLSEELLQKLCTHLKLSKNRESRVLAKIDSAVFISASSNEAYRSNKYDTSLSNYSVKQNYSSTLSKTRFIKTKPLPRRRPLCIEDEITGISY